MTTSRAAIAILFSLSFAHADSLEEVLNRMDAAAPQFKSMSAQIKRTDYTKNIDNTDESSGTMRMRVTQKNGPECVIEFTGGDPAIVSLNGHTAKKYLPKAKQQQVFEAGKSLSAMQETLLLGFGARKAKLLQIYEITLGGPETLGAKRTTRIQLTPKSKDLKDLFTKIDLWIPDGESYPAQEKIWTGTKGNYNLAVYSDLKINPPLPDSAFQFTPPQGTEIIKAN